MNPTLYYNHDPMCAWCWGYRPVWDALQLALPESINIEYVVGGLAPDSDQPMPMAMQNMIQGHWRTIQAKLGTKFNFDFWSNNIPRRSTYMACRATVAAKDQAFEIEMIDKIQQGYYLRALNPSDISVLNQLAAEICETKPQLNLADFSSALLSKETQCEFERQIQLARELSVQGFPSLVIEAKGQRRSITIDYLDYRDTLAEIIEFAR